MRIESYREGSWMMKLAASFLVFMFAWLPMAALGLVSVACLLLTSWDGRSTWFGNYLYGRLGNSHVPPEPSFWQQWHFLAIRNPVSNFGKFTLSRGPYDRAWLVEKRLGRFGILYGWKHHDDRLPGSRRPFVFRPFFR